MFCVLQNQVQVGPDSVGHHLQQKGLAFGGDVTTATDVAIVTGLLAPFGGASVPTTIRAQTAYSASMQMYKMISDTIDAIKVHLEFTCYAICTICTS